MIIDRETGEILTEQAPAATLETIKELVRLKKEIKDLEAQAEELKSRFSIIEPAVISFMEQSGMQKITVDSRTVFIKRQLWASLNKEIPDALQIMKDAGAGDFIKETVNTMTMSAYVREQEKEGTIPEWCNKALSVTEKFNVGIRKA